MCRVATKTNLPELGLIVILGYRSVVETCQEKVLLGLKRSLRAVKVLKMKDSTPIPINVSFGQQKNYVLDLLPLVEMQHKEGRPSFSF